MAKNIQFTPLLAIRGIFREHVDGPQPFPAAKDYPVQYCTVAWSGPPRCFLRSVHALSILGSKTKYLHDGSMVYYSTVYRGEAHSRRTQKKKFSAGESGAGVIDCYGTVLFVRR